LNIPKGQPESVGYSRNVLYTQSVKLDINVFLVQSILWHFNFIINSMNIYFCNCKRCHN